MKFIKITTTAYLILILLGTSIVGQPVLAAAGNSSDYSWAEKFGYIQWADGSNYEGALVSDSSLVNYLWSEKAGYISLSCDNTSSCATVDYQVTIDGSGNFSGYAWSEKAGFINLDDAGALYAVTTTWSPSSAPTITTQTALDITTTSVAGQGNITDVGGNDATIRGFKYALTATSTCDTWDVNESGTFSAGAYSLAISGLTKGVTYFYRAYAMNVTGTGYGTCQAFTTAVEATPIILKKNVILKERIRLK